MTDEAPKTPRKRASRAKPPEDPTPPETPQVAEDPLPAVIVARVTTDDGGLDTKVIINGDVRPTEVETLLKMGLQGWQRQIGV